jgi:hypothetical protein
LANQGRVVVGVAEHAGWAHLVSVAMVNGRPSVVDRRRVELIEGGVPTQPYHHETLSMPNAEAERLVRRVRTSIAESTSKAFDALARDLAPRSIAAIAIRLGTLECLPATVADAHASYHVQCRADGMLYFSAACDAARQRGWDIQCLQRGHEVDAAAAAMGTGPGAVERLMDDLKRTLGSPWTADHRFACAAAMATLGARSPTA